MWSSRQELAGFIVHDLRHEKRKSNADHEDRPEVVEKDHDVLPRAPAAEAPTTE